MSRAIHTSVCTFLILAAFALHASSAMAQEPGGKEAAEETAIGSFEATLKNWRDMAPVGLDGRAYVLHDLQRQYVNILLCPSDEAWALGVTSHSPRKALPAPGVQPHGAFIATIQQRSEGPAVTGFPFFLGDLQLDEVSDRAWIGRLSASPPSGRHHDARLELLFHATPITLERAAEVAPMANPLQGCAAVARPPAVATPGGTAAQALAELPPELRESATAAYDAAIQSLSAAQRETYDACVLDAVARIDPSSDPAVLRWTRIQLERSISSCEVLARQMSTSAKAKGGPPPGAPSGQTDAGTSGSGRSSDSRRRASTWLFTPARDEFERLLDPDQFLRIHRSHIVNLRHLRSMEPHDGARLEVRMRDGTRIVASRSRSRELRKLAV